MRQRRPGSARRPGGRLGAYTTECLAPRNQVREGPGTVVCARRCPALPRPGGRSTIGAGVLSFRVRDGSGRVLPAVTAEAVVGLGGAGCGVWCGGGGLVVGRIVDAGVLSGWLAGCVLCRPVSTSQLSPLPGVHVWPIYPVVCWGPSNTRGCCGDLVLKVVSRLDAFSGYPCPNVANQWCPWRDSWRTRGSSVPVLSY